jgi:hypothetical protein
MGQAKRVLCVVGTSIVIGGLLGMLYAPAEGCETRRKLNRLKRKFGCCGEDFDEDRESLEELRVLLQKELNKINEKLESLGKG